MKCKARTQLARLVEAFAEVGEALLDGSISVANAEVIARAWANPRVHERFAGLLGHFLTQASRLEHDDFKLVVERFVLLADVDGTHRDRELNHENRDANFTEFQGQGTLIGQFGDLDTATNKDVFDKFVQAEWDADSAWAVATHGDDALSAMIRRAGSVPAGKPGKVVTNIAIDWQSFQDLMARANLFPEREVDPFEQAETLVSQWRCETFDGQLLDPEAVLRAALEGYVRFVVLDDEGVPIRWGRERRLFEGAALDAVMSLSPRCTHPGCRVPASRSQADHMKPWAEGGTTDPSNGGPKSARHNLLRNKGFPATRDRWGWHTYRPDGTEIC